MESAKINILSDEVVGKISAGEVVERPASVVKELLENSIDAGSDSIEVEIQSAGQALIRVADNGEGMTPEDAKMACQRHATSKIRIVDDLDHIGTLGFRGEALSSIAAVSQMDITSRMQAGETGVYVYLESGEILKMRPAGRAPGTTVEVRNLFYNVPARRKFLKKESTELAEIVSVAGRFIIAYPGIEFKLTQSSRCLLHATKDMGMIERIRLVLGGDVSDHMMDISNSAGGHTITGYVSRPSSTRKDKRAQMFFVNGRFVRSRLLSDTVYDAYRSMLERGRYPAVVLFLTVSPPEVDVNVHPAKLEVKFGDERAVKDIIVNTIRNRFDEVKYAGAEPRSAPAFPGAARTEETENPVLSGVPEVQTEFPYDFRERGAQGQAPGKSERVPAEREDFAPPVMGNMFQIAACYIVQVREDGITVTDQHAAHERILYEFFSRASKNGHAEAQNLLFPVRIDLSAAESIVMEKVAGYFRTLGFHIEPFGERSFVAQTVPAVLKDRDTKTVIYDVLADLSSRDLARIDVLDELVKLTSCRAAIKAGDALGKAEMASLLDQLGRCSLPFTCPHGRPTMIDITIGELEKRFRRK
ncbi:MAG: DNA mismatch repair endonuclease MutL [Candidatus Makaraimicrobium thalassicum]|nr:MAG: DNA mismatch repair endonuclease MutL [Candidatus Omnitrophota bacterium]